VAQITAASGGVWAADLDRSTDGLEVLLRNSAPLADPGALGGADWWRFSGTTVSQVGPSLGGSGSCVNGGNVLTADVQRVGRGKVVSIARDLNSPTPAGWIHIVAIQ
jgi:hypothetical protein